MKGARGIIKGPEIVLGLMPKYKGAVHVGEGGDTSVVPRAVNGRKGKENDQ
jgi:hypothetical protein